MFKANNAVSLLLEVFLRACTITNQIKTSISSNIFSYLTKITMPLQFGLAAAVDNHLALKWLNNLLYKLGFAVSYNEVRKLHKI